MNEASRFRKTTWMSFAQDNIMFDVDKMTKQTKNADPLSPPPLLVTMTKELSNRRGRYNLAHHLWMWIELLQSRQIQVRFCRSDQLKVCEVMQYLTSLFSFSTRGFCLITKKTPLYGKRFDISGYMERVSQKEALQQRDHLSYVHIAETDKDDAKKRFQTWLLPRWRPYRDC